MWSPCLCCSGSCTTSCAPSWRFAFRLVPFWFVSRTRSAVSVSHLYIACLDFGKVLAGRIVRLSFLARASWKGIQVSSHTAPKRQLTWHGRWFLQGLSVLLRVFAPSSPENGCIYSMSVHKRAIDSLTFVVFDSSASHAIVSSGRYTVFTTCKGRS